MPANPNLLPVSEADREAAWPFAPERIKYNPNPGSEERWMAGHYDGSDLLQAFAAHRLAAEQSQTSAFVAMLEGMKRDSLPGLNAVIDDAIANAKAGRAG